MKVGILGGGFDPPHLGHLWAAQQALETAGLDEVWFIPYNKRNLFKSCELRVASCDRAQGTRHKAQVANNEQRLEMARLAIRGQKKFKVLDMEIKRGGVSYTIDTVIELKEKFLNYEFFIIIGADLVEELPKWKEHEKLIKMVKFLVLLRNGDNTEIQNNLDLQIIRPEVTTNLSSTIIRERVKKGLSINRMVRKGVERYIYKNKLYVGNF